MFTLYLIMNDWIKLESNKLNEGSEDSFRFVSSKEKVLEVMDSLIHKKGVFSIKKIPQNTIFYIIPVNDLKSFPSKGLFRLSKGVFVNDPLVLNFVNHSCEPNSKLLITQEGVFLESMRMIDVGEEITLDYTLTEEMGELIECNCKSVKCKRFFYTTN